MFGALVLLVGALAHTDPVAADARTFYLQHLEARGFPELLGRLVEERSPWVGDLPDHWDALRTGLKVDAGRNAVQANGPADALQALENVVRALDVARPTVKLSYRHLRVPNLPDLLGSTAAPPAPDPIGNRSDLLFDALIATGDWSTRVAELLNGGKAQLLHEGEISVIDGHLACVYLGDPEAKWPEFCLYAWPTVVEEGSIWLSVACGTLRRRGASGPEGEAKPTSSPTEAVCINCGPGLGEVVLEPEKVLTTRVEPGQSVLLGGLWWHLVGEERSPEAAHEFTIVTPEVTK